MNCIPKKRMYWGPTRAMWADVSLRIRTNLELLARLKTDRRSRRAGLALSRRTIRAYALREKMRAY